MIFKDREEAGKKLTNELLRHKDLLKDRKNIVIVSLLRGGVVVGGILARKLGAKHIWLAVTKIGAPHNPELAIGAVCFNTIFLQKDEITEFGFSDKDVENQVSLARVKHDLYIQKYNLQKINYNTELKNKIVIITDDGVATGATTKAAQLFVKNKKPEQIILAVPVAPTDFNIQGFDKVVILHKDPMFGAVSQFYENFPQAEPQA